MEQKEIDLNEIDLEAIKRQNKKDDIVLYIVIAAWMTFITIVIMFELMREV